MATGYLHPSYIESLQEFGTPQELPRCGGWILERQIPGSTYQDGMGCYPIFTCQDWSQLYLDLEDIEENQWITLSLVADPFGEYDHMYLHQCFRDIVVPFKQHFVTDLNQSMNTYVADHHRRYARKVLQSIQVEKCQNPIQFIDEWVQLYTTLIDRHSIKGISAFSKLAFAKQLDVPGTVLFRAIYEDMTVGMLWWYIKKNVGYYHLGAYSNQGYNLRVSFGLFWFAIEYFAASGLNWLNLGAGAGVESNGKDGLSRFKEGWSTDTRTAYFCGRIFNQARYEELIQAKGIATTNYFPAYRQGEFI